MQPYLLFQNLLKTQHVSSGVPLIIRSSKLYFHTLVYINKPLVYINQRLQIQFGAPDDERYAARNMLSLQ